MRLVVNRLINVDGVLLVIGQSEAERPSGVDVCMVLYMHVWNAALLVRLLWLIQFTEHVEGDEDILVVHPNYPDDE